MELSDSMDGERLVFSDEPRPRVLAHMPEKNWLNFWRVSRPRHSGHSGEASASCSESRSLISKIASHSSQQYSYRAIADTPGHGSPLRLATELVTTFGPRFPDPAHRISSPPAPDPRTRPRAPARRSSPRGPQPPPQHSRSRATSPERPTEASSPRTQAQPPSSAPS